MPTTIASLQRSVAPPRKAATKTIAGKANATQPAGALSLEVVLRAGLNSEGCIEAVIAVEYVGLPVCALQCESVFSFKG
jgi:hypothetical protein